MSVKAGRRYIYHKPAHTPAMAKPSSQIADLALRMSGLRLVKDCQEHIFRALLGSVVSRCYECASSKIYGAMKGACKDY